MTTRWVADDATLARIAELERENEQWQSTMILVRKALCGDIHNQDDIVEMAKGLRKDAERYRFARGRAYVAVNPHAKTCLWVLRRVYEVSYDAAKLHGFDAAIDAAIASEKENERG